MRKKIFLVGLVIIVLLGGLYAKKRIYDPRHRMELAKNEVKLLTKQNEIKEGDIIFQTSLSKQSKAIQLATKSKYSHCGIIFKDESGFYVLEAVQPVKETSLEKWIARGRDGYYIIKRLINVDQIMTPEVINNMKQIGEKLKGKNYDLTFEWSDNKIYCSELIWKIYQRSTGMEIGKLQKLKEFDLSNENVRKIMNKRYGNNIPLEEKVISPAAIFNSELLMTVKSNE
jgi:hypothetical protein